jgi:DNA-binding transcriptional LysR family regulator
LDLRQLEYFRTAARREHMTRAAEELGIAQSALSKTIARLEDDLGVPLFDRQGRRIRLNQFGRAFLERVDRALAQLEDGRREVADLAGLEHGQVALAATTLRWVPELLHAFRARYPHVRFRLIQAETAAMRQQLARGESDLCLASLPLDGPGVQAVPVLTEEILLAVPATHRLAERGRIQLGEVADEPFISLKPGYDLRELTDQVCRQAGFAPHIVCEVDEPAAIRGLVRAGLGVAFLPAASWRIVGEPDPVPLHIEAPTCQRILQLAWRDGRYLSAAARQFRAFVIAYFARLP